MEPFARKDAVVQLDQSLAGLRAGELNLALPVRLRPDGPRPLTWRR